MPKIAAAGDTLDRRNTEHSCMMTRRTINGLHFTAENGEAGPPTSNLLRPESQINQTRLYTKRLTMHVLSKNTVRPGLAEELRL